MKVIETPYDGRVFRSRLEARWAVFFKALGIQSDYEPEGYDLGEGLFYLPDFWLPTQELFFEIKPVSPEEGGVELEKARRLSRLTKRPVIIYVGSPRLTEYGSGEGFPRCVFPERGEDFPFLWCECPNCGRLDLQFDGRADRIKCRCKKSGDKGYNYDSRRLKMAFEIATSHRFWEGPK